MQGSLFIVFLSFLFAEEGGSNVIPQKERKKERKEERKKERKKERKRERKKGRKEGRKEACLTVSEDLMESKFDRHWSAVHLLIARI